MGLTIVREKITDSTLDAISAAAVAEFSESGSQALGSLALGIALRITARVALCRNHVSSAELPLQ